MDGERVEKGGEVVVVSEHTRPTSSEWSQSSIPMPL